MVLLWCLVGALVVRRREFDVLLVCHLDSAPSLPIVESSCLVFVAVE